MRPAAGQRKVVHETDLIGMRVRNTSGKNLRVVEDIMIDLPGVCVAYAVLSFGGFPGLGDKLFAIPWPPFAIPWPALRLDPQEGVFILNVERELLKRAPGFNKRDWPDMTDLEWGERIFSHYGYPPYWK